MTQSANNVGGGQDQQNWWAVTDPGNLNNQNPAKHPATPPPPDYIGAAREQGTQNIALAKVNAMLNNPDVKNPFGTSKVTFDANGRPSVDQQLAPGLQSSADSLMGQSAANFAKPFDYTSASDLQNKVEQSILSRLEPQFNRDEDSLRTRLANQGITSQSNPTAFGNDIDAFNRAKTDARLQAVLTGMQAAPQALQQEEFIRSEPLANLQTIISGQKGSLPQFSGTANAQAGNYQGAVDKLGQYNTDIFNYGQAQNQKQQQNLMSAASLAALAFI